MKFEIRKIAGIFAVTYGQYDAWLRNDTYKLDGGFTDGDGRGTGKGTNHIGARIKGCTRIKGGFRVYDIPDTEDIVIAIYGPVCSTPESIIEETHQ